MADIPSRVRLYREEIKQCILNDSVLSHLHDIIPPGAEIRLRQLYDNDRPNATGQLLDMISESEEPGKWQRFIAALRDSEYPHLVHLLETSNRPSQNYDHERKIIQIFWPYLAKRIDPSEIVGYLYAAKIITMEDLQVINSKQNNVGQHAGAVALLERIQCRQEPGVWYEKLLELMMEKSLDDLVKEMEPEFYASKQQPGSEQLCSIRETVTSDSGEAYASENNLSPPDRQADFQMEMTEVSEAELSTVKDSITHAKKQLFEMNISGEDGHNWKKGDNIEAKTLNITLADDDESEDDFHDAVEDHELTGESIEEIDNKQNELRADMKVFNTPPNNAHKVPDVVSDKKIEIRNRNDMPNSEDNVNKGNNNRQPNFQRKENEGVNEIYNRQPQTEADEESDDDNLSSDDDFLADEAEGLNLYEKLKLRNYQLELAENAVRGDNTIICAETGSGKTWVALHIIKNHLDRSGNGRVVFMARTGALIKQQSDRFKRFLPMYETILLTGDSENTLLLSQLLDGFHIFCMTPQVLLNNLERNPDHLAIHNFSMLIFDECHHTKKDEPYNKVMRLYLEEKLSPSKLQLPQVIGLTASIGVGKSHNDVEAMEYILSICANLDSKNLSTVEQYKDELKKHVNLPNEELVQMEERKIDPCRSILQMAIKNIEAKLEDLVELNSSYINIMNSCPLDKTTQEYAKWTYELMKVTKLSDDGYEETRNISTCAKYLSVLSAALEVNSLLRTEDVQKFLSERLGHDRRDKSKLTNFEADVLNELTDDVKKMRQYARGIENPNVRLLSKTLREMMDKKGEDSRAMVFVKSRATCKSLSTFLDTDLADIGIKVAPLYGKENREDEDGMSEGRQNETVERFRNGDYKVLVATSVGSEGIDVPDCNIVLSYNYTGNEITKIQMSGRSRKKGGIAMVLGDQNIVRREVINAYKATMMYRAMKLVKLLSQKDYDRKVWRMQKEEVERAKFRKGMEALAQSKRTDDTVYELKCARCNTFACYSTDIKVLKNSQHIVVSKDFVTRINIKPHRSPKKFEGMTKTSKMHCKKCPLDWGIGLDYHGLKCWTLKLACFKFVNTETNAVTEYKKWIEVPFLPPATEYEDLLKLLG